MHRDSSERFPWALITEQKLRQVLHAGGWHLGLSVDRHLQISRRSLLHRHGPAARIINLPTDLSPIFALVFLTKDEEVQRDILRLIRQVCEEYRPIEISANEVRGDILPPIGYAEPAD